MEKNQLLVQKLLKIMPWTVVAHLSHLPDFFHWMTFSSLPLCFTSRLLYFSLIDRVLHTQHIQGSSNCVLFLEPPLSRPVPCALEGLEATVLVVLTLFPVLCMLHPQPQSPDLRAQVSLREDVNGGAFFSHFKLK